MAFQQYNFKSHRLIHAAIKALENVCCRWGWSKNTELDHSIGRKKDFFGDQIAKAVSQLWEEGRSKNKQIL